MIERISGSKAERVRQCPASSVLPHVERADDSPAAIRGSDVHAYLEVVHELGIDAALARAPEELRPFLAAIDVDALPVTLATEVAFAWDWKARKGREIGRNLNRDYSKANPPLGPTEDPITVDITGVDQSSLAWSNEHGGDAITIGYVADYKTGRTRYPLPERFAQTLLGALCVRDVWKTSEVRVEIIYIGFNGDDYRVKGVADEWILDDFADEWAAARELVHHYEAERLAGRDIPLREGSHCTYCPAFKQCPAKMALVRALPLEVEIMDHDRERGIIPREHMAAAWRRAEQLKSILGQIQNEITMAAAIEPIDLGDGMWLGPVESRREFLDGPIAASVLERWYGREARDAAITIKLSKDALRTAVTAHRKPGEKISTKKGDGALDLILDEIRKRNGVEIQTSHEVKVHPVKRLRSGE